MIKLTSWAQLVWVAGIFVWIGANGLSDPSQAFILGLGTGYSFLDGAFGILTGKSTLSSAWRFATHVLEKGKQP